MVIGDEVGVWSMREEEGEPVPERGRRDVEAGGDGRLMGWSMGPRCRW